MAPFPPVPEVQGARHAIVLTSYRRPGNIARIAIACTQAVTSSDVLLIDNADDAALRVHPEHLPGSVRYLPNARNLGAGYRFLMASQLDYDRFLFIDDDIFLTPAQIDALFAALDREPGRAHGVWGEIIERRWRGLRFKTHIQSATREVDILNRVYALSASQTRGAIALARALGIDDWADIGPTDDILVSFAGAQRPVCHDVGSLAECPSSDQPGIAVWRRRGFYKARRAMVHALLRRSARARGATWLKFGMPILHRANGRRASTRQKEL